MATIPVNELTGVIDLEEEIGSGAYGVVKLVSVHGTVCAAKDVHKILLQHVSRREYTAVKEKFMQECVHCSRLLHPNIVQFLGIYYPNKHVELPWLIMERLDCNLSDFVEINKQNEIYFLVKASIFHDILLGLQYLHAQNIIHRDLSSNNILLTKFLVAKIADLGMAKLVDPSVITSQSKQPGTAIFMPPEALIDHSRYDSSIDVFSFGCVMVHLMSQEFPCPEPQRRLDKIAGRFVALSETERREKYLTNIHKPPELKKLILQSLDDIPERRPSINSFLEYFEIFLKQQAAQGICLAKDQKINKLQVDLSVRDKQLMEIQQINNNLIAEVYQLKSSNHRLSLEIDRLIKVDQELVKTQEALKNANNELATKEILVQAYKEDFEQERKDRENAHRIKEEEIMKVRIKMEELVANHQMELKRMQDYYKDQTLQKVTVEGSKSKSKNDKLPEDVNSNMDSNGFSEQLEAHNKEEGIHTGLQELVTKQLNAQRQLNQQLHAMSNIFMRKKAGISLDPQLSTSISSHLMQEVVTKQLKAQHQLNQLLHAMKNILMRKKTNSKQQDWQWLPSPPDTSFKNTLSPATNPDQLDHFPTMRSNYPAWHGPMNKHFTPRLPYHSISEGINEEIHVQANLRQRQQHEEDMIETGLPYDPFLICHKCNHQFREGQLPEYRHHIDNCHQ